MRSIYDFVPAPIAHYKMDDNLATDVIVDEIGNHNGVVKDATGTATSAFHSVAGKINNAQSFDNTDDYIEIADHADFTPASKAFSISVWIYMREATGLGIASKGAFNIDGEWELRTFGAEDKLIWRVFDESENSCFIGRKSNAGITAYENQWIHIVGTYNGGTLSSGLKMYINGSLVADSAYELNQESFEEVEPQAHTVWIGRTSSYYTDGDIDDVKIFDKVLTAEQVKKLFDSLRGREFIYGPRPNRIYAQGPNKIYVPHNRTIFGG